MFCRQGSAPPGGKTTGTREETKQVVSPARGLGVCRISFCALVFLCSLIFLTLFALEAGAAENSLLFLNPCSPAACFPASRFFLKTSSVFERQEVESPTFFSFAPTVSNRDSQDSSGWFSGGHLEFGWFGNAYGRTNRYRDGELEPESGNTLLLQNVHQTDVQLNQLYLNFGKSLDSRNRLDIGGRVDVMFGTDALLAQSGGLERQDGLSQWNTGDYYTALPQAFIEVGTQEFSVKMGKFLSPMGEESLLSTERFFYSLSDTYALLPQTLTGVLGEWQAGSRLSVQGGWVNGENATFENEKESALIGDVSYRVNKNMKLAYSAMAKLDGRTKTRDDTFDFSQSFIFGYRFKKASYTLEWSIRNRKTGGGGRMEYGLNQELIHKINSRWSLGARFGWTHRFTKSGLGYERCNLTFGANWRPNKWLLIRPELRYDFCEGLKPFNKPKDGTPGGRKDQWSGGISTVIKF